MATNECISDPDVIELKFENNTCSDASDNNTTKRLDSCTLQANEVLVSDSSGKDEKQLETRTKILLSKNRKQEIPVEPSVESIPKSGDISSIPSTINEVSQFASKEMEDLLEESIGYKTTQPISFEFVSQAVLHDNNSRKDMSNNTELNNVDGIITNSDDAYNATAATPGSVITPSDALNIQSSCGVSDNATGSGSGVSDTVMTEGLFHQTRFPPVISDMRQAITSKAGLVDSNAGPVFPDAGQDKTSPDQVITDATSRVITPESLEGDDCLRCTEELPEALSNTDDDSPKKVHDLKFSKFLALERSKVAKLQGTKLKFKLNEFNVLEMIQ